MPYDSAMGLVQAAVYGKLRPNNTTDSQLTQLGVQAVVDSVPEPLVWTNYVLLGESFELADNTLGAAGRNELLTVDTYVMDTTSGTGWKTADAVNSRVVALLDGATLTISGRTVVAIQFEESQKIYDPPWRHIASDFRIWTED